MGFNRNDVIEVLKEVASVIEENKQYLTDLDAAIGDGDHGINMSRGFTAAIDKLNQTEPETIESAIKTVAMALISTVGGASGPLYGSLFLKASAMAKDKVEIGLNDFCLMLNAGIESVKQRGRSDYGEKTMLDVLIPVYDLLKSDSENGVSAAQCFSHLSDKAKECVEKTKDIVATKGRASYVGERSLGHIDPGAMSSCLIIETIYKCIVKRSEDNG